MGAPGTLIPVEAPNSQFQSHALDMKSVVPITGSSAINSLPVTYGGMDAEPESCPADETANARPSSSRNSFLSIEAKGESLGVSDRTPSKKVTYDPGNLLPLLSRSSESSALYTDNSSVQQAFQVNNASDYVSNVGPQNVFPESNIYMPSNVVLVEKKGVGEDHLSENLVHTGVHQKRIEHSIVPFTGVQFPKQLENNASTDASG